MTPSLFSPAKLAIVLLCSAAIANPSSVSGATTTSYLRRSSVVEATDPSASSTQQKQEQQTSSQHQRALQTQQQQQQNENSSIRFDLNRPPRGGGRPYVQPKLETENFRTVTSKELEKMKAASANAKNKADRPHVVPSRSHQQQYRANKDGATVTKESLQGDMSLTTHSVTKEDKNTKNKDPTLPSKHFQRKESPSTMKKSNNSDTQNTIANHSANKKHSEKESKQKKHFQNKQKKHKKGMSETIEKKVDPIPSYDARSHKHHQQKDMEGTTTLAKTPIVEIEFGRQFAVYERQPKSNEEDAVPREAFE